MSGRSLEDVMDTGRTRFLGVTADEVGKYVFVPGSVERAELISRHFDEPVLVARKREFLTYSGFLNGEKVTVTSTGIGGPSTDIVVHELASLGAHTFLRVGSAASTSDKVRRGDVVIPNAAVRMEGTGHHYLPVEFPAVPDTDLLEELAAAAERLGLRYNVGATVTKDSFYTESEPETKPVYDELKYRWDSYLAGGATNTSMECSLLFLMGAYYGLRTASVMISATNHNDYSNDLEDYPDNIEERAILVGIEAIRSLIEADRKREGRWFRQA